MKQQKKVAKQDAIIDVKSKHCLRTETLQTKKKYQAPSLKMSETVPLVDRGGPAGLFDA